MHREVASSQRVGAGVPDGIRTRVTALKGRRPRPLDDRDDRRDQSILAAVPVSRLLPRRVADAPAERDNGVVVRANAIEKVFQVGQIPAVFGEMPGERFARFDDELGDIFRFVRFVMPGRACTPHPLKDQEGSTRAALSPLCSRVMRTA